MTPGPSKGSRSTSCTRSESHEVPQQHGVLSAINSGIEAFARGLLVNIPTYLLSIAEVDNACAMIMAYMLMQIVGFCWAFLVNAAFALACRSTELLPPVMQQSESATATVLSHEHVSSYSSMQLIAAFYVSYASIRVVIGFAQSVFSISLESVKSFPDVAKRLSRGGKTTLHLIPLVFIPPIVVMVSLMCADRVCERDDATQPWQRGLCDNSGISYLSSKKPDLRRLTVYSVFLVVIQLWQAALHQFPNWREAFMSLKWFTRLVFQLAVLLLAVISTFVGVVFLFLERALDVSTSHAEEIVCLVLLGWTLWLLCFIPVLVRTHGDSWEQESRRALALMGGSFRPSLFTSPFRRNLSRTSLGSRTSDSSTFNMVDLDDGVEQEVADNIDQMSQQSGRTESEGNDLRVFAAFIRVSHMLLLSLIFGMVCFHRGYPEAQLLIAFLTIVVPALYCFTYLLCVIIIKAGVKTVIFGAPFAFAFAFVVTTLAKTAGNGSIILVFFHAMNKGAQFFCEEDDEEEEVGGTPSKAPRPPDDDTHEPPALPTDGSSSANLSGLSSSVAAAHVQGNQARRRGQSNSNQTATAPRRQCSQDSMASVHSSAALHQLEQRGARNSALVSIVPEKVKEHWLTRALKKNMQFLFSVTRKLTVSDSHVSGMVRLFSTVSIILALILAMISSASFLQQRLKFYPKLIDFRHDVASNSVLFDHRISNVTLHMASPETHARQCSRASSSKKNGKADGICDAPSQTLGSPPSYALCSWKWHDSLSLLDLSLMSQLAYFDDTPSGSLQSMVDVLFPPSLGFDFQVRSSPQLNSGPMHLEFHSPALGLTVVAVRGTDVGRLRDFMEDVNLYSEPVVYSLLSLLFPTIRLWTHDTTSRLIEWLFDFNSFFGLKAEAEFYRPLTERVFEISNSSSKVILTGHSLGGGLARIVGTLTGLPSASFSPPGLKLSYRKYSAQRPDGTVIKVPSIGTLHHQSITVVTEMDWITQIDVQVGLVQHILCDHDSKAHQNSCHLLEGTICHLLKHCGDSRQRFVAPYCESSFNIAAVYPGLVAYFSQHRLILLPLILIVLFLILLAIVPEVM